MIQCAISKPAYSTSFPKIELSNTPIRWESLPCGDLEGDQLETDSERHERERIEDAERYEKERKESHELHEKERREDRDRHEEEEGRDREEDGEEPSD